MFEIFKRSRSNLKSVPTIRAAGSTFTYTPRWSRPDKGPVERVCPYEFTIVSGNVAEASLPILANSRPGCTPMILGGLEGVATLLESFELNEQNPDQIIGDVADLDLDDWFRTREKEAEELYPEYPNAPSGEWPNGGHSMTSITSVRDVSTHEYLSEVLVALLPTPDPTLSAAYLKFGDWNDCPSPQIHVALAQRWQKSHDARLVVNTYDVLEFQVGRPIQAREEALDMARVQYLYCTDIVEQGTETLEALAATLCGSSVWYFWWD
jgi:hypothetical protein